MKPHQACLKPNGDFLEYAVLSVVIKTTPRAIENKIRVIQKRNYCEHELI